MFNISEISISLLAILLVILFCLSAFFSGSETALMALNRYKMRHHAKLQNKGAIAAKKLLKNPEKLIGIILLGNNLTNILITQIATLLSLRIFGDIGLAIATGFLTLFILIFAELAPKTMGAKHSEKIAYPAALIYQKLLFIFYPFVALINFISNSLLKVLGVNELEVKTSLSSDELKTFIKEAGSKLSSKHLNMLESIVDLENSTVIDVMIPKSDIYGIDIEEDEKNILDRITKSAYTRIPVYKKNIENIIGFIHIKKISQKLLDKDFKKSFVENILRDSYFVADSTSLLSQLINFQKEKRRMGMVVDEYGDLLGMIFLDDILEEIVGDYTSDPISENNNIIKEHDGAFIIDGGLHIKEVNALLGTSFNYSEAKTLNGLIVEQLENMPQVGSEITIDNYNFNIISIEENIIDKIKVKKIV